MDAQTKVDELLAQKLFLEQLENSGSKCSTLVDQALNNFNKWQRPFVNTLRQILESAEPLNAQVLLGGNRTLLLAITVQNWQHPKNANRVDAVKAGQYKELRSEEEAFAFINQIIAVNFKNELLGIESECKGKLASLQQMQDVKLVLEAPDFYTAAAVLVQQNFYNGKGDRTALFNVVLNTDPKTLPDIGRKLKLMTMREIHGFKIYNDKLCNTMEVKRSMVHQLWLHLCRRHQAATVEQLIEFAPNLTDHIMLWDQFVDANGRTTQNSQEYAEYRKKMEEKAKIRKLQK